MHSGPEPLRHRAFTDSVTRTNAKAANMSAEMNGWLEKRWARWVAAFGFWTVIGIFYGSKRSMRGVPTDWFTSYKNAMPQWYVWGLLAPLIIAVDRRLPVSRDALGRRLVWHLPLAAVFTGLFLYGEAWADTLLGMRDDGLTLSPRILAQGFQGGFHWNLLIYWAIVGVYLAYDYYERYQERRLEAVQLEKLLAESRLSALQTQLHPHFLFNALNTVSAHVERDPRGARRMLEQLGDLLRLSLDHADRQEITLEEELEFLERYLAIQRARFEDRLEVQVDADADALEAKTPSLVLQPLVENAIRFGVEPRSVQGRITVEASRSNGDLRLRVTDDGPGLPQDFDPQSSTGVGLRNTRERLRRLYGEEQSFAIRNRNGGGVEVEMSLPYRGGPKSQ